MSAGAPPPTQLTEVLSGPFDGVTRIAITHRRCSAFRPFSIVEEAARVLFIAVFLFCLLLVLILLMILYVVMSLDGGDDAHYDPHPGEGRRGGGCLPRIPMPWKVRYYRHWQELEVQLQDGQGNVLRGFKFSPRSRAQGDAILCAVLATAQQAGVVVVEGTGSVDSMTEIYYAGQPLMAAPQLRDPQACQADLERVGYVVERGDYGLEVRRTAPSVPRWRAGLVLVIELLLLPVLFWKASFRASLRSTFLDLRGVPPEVWILAIHTSRRLSIRRERGGSVREDLDLDARDILAVTYGPWLDYDLDITRRDADFRVLTKDRAHSLPALPAARALRDFVVAEAIELWEGIPAVATRPTRCPYCGSLYVLAEGTNCPSCGASAGVFG